MAKGGKAQKAEALRKLGNEKYKKKDFPAASKLYTQAMGVCPGGRESEELPLCLGNLSAVLFERGRYNITN